MIYTCPRCGFITDRKFNIKYHINKIKICKPILGDADLKEYEKTLDKSYNKILKLKNEENEKNLKELKNENEMLKKLKLENEKLKLENEKLKLENEMLKIEVKNLKIEIKNLKIKNKIEIFSYELNYIYILREREFEKTDEPIYKIGFTTKGILGRLDKYPKASKVYCTIPVNGNPEKKIIDHFDTIFKKRTDIGNEYYEGNFITMYKVLTFFINNSEESII